MSSQAPGRTRPRFNRRTGAAVFVAALTMVGASAMVADAAVPTAEVGNLVVFPDRDFVTVEGYQDHVGETATITVTRGGSVVGQASAKIAEGDVAFEINHPGGACWGDGAPSSLKVTPDIKAGDKVAISINGGDEGDTTVQDASVDEDATVSGTTVTVKGHIGSGVNPAQLEQRIVEPALRPFVTRRDARAVPGGLVTAPKGGYASNLVVGSANGDGVRPVTATYEFNDAQAAQLAANTVGERMMAWQVEDGEGNRQGLTIAEFGEAGGPGMGGCPAGPGSVGAPQPGQASVVRSSDKTSAQVNWAPATATAGGAAITGYSIEAVGPTSSGEATVIGKRTGASATRVTLNGLTASADYTVEVRSITGSKLSEPFTANTGGAPQNPGNPTLPTITANPAGGATAEEAVAANSVTLSGTTTDIYYTTDGSSAIEGDAPSLTAQLYTGPIAITGPTELHWAIFNADGLNDVGDGFYTKAAAAPLAAPTLGNSTVSGKSITLRWNAVTGATKYGVQVTDAAGTLIGAVRETTGLNLTVDNLPAGSYFFTVKAADANGSGPASVKSGELKVLAGDVVRISSATWKASDFRISGTSSSATGTLTAYRVTVAANGTVTKGAALGSAAATAAAAPATGGVFEIRLRNAAAGTTNPGRIVVSSSNGGDSPVFTVTNK